MMDPFLGIGHSAIAARRCGIREFIGFDIDPSYVRLARAALAKGSTEPTLEVLPDAIEPRRRGRERGDTLFEMDRIT
jgi:DNA modification methylase